LDIFVLRFLIDLSNQASPATSKYSIITMMSIMSENGHQSQDPSVSSAPQTPQHPRHLLPELPAPPARSACEFIGVDESKDNHSNIYMPMLTPTSSTPSSREERPGHQPRLSNLMLDVNSEECSLLSTPVAFSSYPHFPSEVTSGPSPAALYDESFSLSDDSTDELFLDFPMANEVHLEQNSRKDPSCWWFCPIPSTIHGDSPVVRLQPRSLPQRSNDEVRDNHFLHLMPIEL
jgi:hypothetical protein